MARRRPAQPRETTDAALAHLLAVAQSWRARRVDVDSVEVSKADLEGVIVRVKFRDRSRWSVRLDFTTGVEAFGTGFDGYLFEALDSHADERTSGLALSISGMIEGYLIETGQD